MHTGNGAPEKTPAKLQKWQKVMLDQVFVQCKGKPEAETIQRICPTLMLEKHQVNT